MGLRRELVGEDRDEKAVLWVNSCTIDFGISFQTAHFNRKSFIQFLLEANA